jgi:predicted DNA binding protein
MFLWAKTADPAAFEAAAVEDPTVSDVEAYTELSEKTLFRVVVSDRATVVTYPEWVDRGASLLSATCQAGVWRGRMRFPGRDALHSLLDWAKSEDVAVTIGGLYDDYEGEGGTMRRLSPEQERTLAQAYEMGHYEIPQRATAGEVAEELDVSQQAVSERLRRAYANLIQHHVLESES